MISTSGEINFNIIFDGESGVAPDGGNEGNPAAPANIGQPNESNPSQAGSNTVAVAAGVNVAMSLGKQAVDAAISNIGLATGNNYAQERAQSIVSAIGTGAGLIASFSNPYTAVAAVGALIISTASQVYAREKQRMWDNRQAHQNAIIYGFSGEDGR